FPQDEKDLSAWNVSEIFLSEADHAPFEIFEGREVKRNERSETNELRFNRYFFDLGERQMEIDVFLNPLWGLCLGKVFFNDREEAEKFEMPEFVIGEVTQDEFFLGKNLVGKSFADVQEEWQKKNG